MHKQADEEKNKTTLRTFCSNLQRKHSEIQNEGQSKSIKRTQTSAVTSGYKVFYEGLKAVYGLLASDPMCIVHFSQIKPPLLTSCWNNLKHP